MPEPFKNLINADVVARLGSIISAVYPKFDHTAFEQDCLATLETLELKERANLIAQQLGQHLPRNTKRSISILAKAIAKLPSGDDCENRDGWLLFPINQFLSKQCVDHFDASMELIREVTIRFTAEFGIRVFLIQRSEETLATLQSWTSDPNQHIRRLVSEGTRPRLPWGEQIKAFIQDPTPIIPLLEALKDDPEEYVRRSVANNLNDISKDHPEQMLDVVEAWLPNAPPQRQRLIRHACRTLIKQGNRRCLTLLGLGTPKLASCAFAVSRKRFKLGGKLPLKVELRSASKAQQPLIIDYRFHFVKANGSTAPKVFKGRKLELDPGASIAFESQIPLRPVTTRKYYSGKTRIELLVNGEALAETSFHLQA